MTSSAPTPSAIAGKPVLQVVIGPFHIKAGPEQILISRSDASVRQQLLVRAQEALGVIEAVILSPGDDGSSEQVIARTQLINLNRAIETITAPIRAAVNQNRAITVDELRDNGYQIVYVENDYWQTFLARAMGQSEIPDFSASFFEELAPELGGKLLDSLKDPSFLDILVENNDTDQPLIAVQNPADQSTMMWIRWRPASKSWVAFPLIPTGIPLLDQQKMRELIIAEGRKAPRFMYFLREFVQALQLEEWTAQTRLNEVYDASTGGFDGKSSLEAIAFDYHLSVYQTEHHHGLARLISSIATRSLSDPQTTIHLHALLAEYTDFAVRTLVERIEIALGRFKHRITAILANGPDQELHNLVKRKKSRDPKECLEAFKAVGVDAVLLKDVDEATSIPTELRHMWTHRGRLLDADFFKGIGRNGQNMASVRVFGRNVELRKGERFEVLDNDVRWFSIVVTVLIDRLYQELVRIFRLP